LITGGGRGIGAATAVLAAQRGYAVAVNYASTSLAADEVVRTIRAGGGTAMAVQADVGDEGAVLTMFAEIDERCGFECHLDDGVNRRHIRVVNHDVRRWAIADDDRIVSEFVLTRFALV